MLRIVALAIVIAIMGVLMIALKLSSAVKHNGKEQAILKQGNDAEILDYPVAAGGLLVSYLP